MDDVFSNVFTFIFGVVAFFGTLIGFAYLIAFTKKPAYKRAYKQGKISVDFDPVDSLNQDMSRLSDNTLKIFNNITAITGKKIEGLRKKQIEHIIIDTRVDNISKLMELAMLLNDDIITTQEFELLKKELLSNQSYQQADHD